MANNEILQFAGELILDSVTLISGDRSKSIDLTLLFAEIDIYEDIFSPSLSGSILITENLNLLTTFPIIGEELLEIGYHTPTLDTKFFKRFAVTAVEGLAIPNSTVKSYALKFVSLEAILDLNIRISKSFEGTPSDSAIAIFNKYLPGVKLNYSQATNVMKFVAPLSTPFTTLSMLASKAIDTSSYGAPNFLFFESNQGYNFVSLTDLYRQQPKMKYRWSFEPIRSTNEKGESVRDIQAEYEIAKQKPDFERIFNTIEKTMNGSFGATTIEVDPIRKTIAKRTYSYVNDFSRTGHLNPNATNDNFAVTSNTAVIDTVITHPYAHDRYSQDRDGLIVSRRPGLLAETEYLKINLIARGRSDLKVGDVVLFEMGQFRSTDETDLTQDGRDKLLTGNYLVSAIMHRITQREHEMHLQIVNESFGNQIKY